MARQYEPPDDSPATDTEDRQNKLRDIAEQLQMLEHMETNTPEGLTNGDRELRQHLEQQQRDLSKQKEIFDDVRPINDNRHPDEPWQRAELILEAHAKISGIEVHPRDVPQAAITDLLKDLMYYCKARSEGEALDSPNRLDFDKLSRFAERQFTVEQRMPEEAALKKAHDTPELKVAAEDRELDVLLKNLGARQAKEALELTKRQELQIHGDPTQWDKKRHQQERDDQTRQFGKERERYITDHNDSKALREKMDAESKQETLEHGIDEGPKLSR